MTAMITPSSQSSGRNIKKRFVMEKWSKEYNVKCKDLQKFNNDKKTLLTILLATLLFLRDIYFSGMDGELTFQPIPCLEQCEQVVRFGQCETNFETNYGSFKEEITNQYQPLEQQADKIPLRTIPVTTIMPGATSGNTYDNYARCGFWQYI